MESIVENKDKLHFFEYLEVDLMQQYLRTGIGYFINAIINAHPALVPLRYWAPEITAIIDFLKDLLTLVSNHATYAENFFGYKRPQMRKWAALKGAFIWTILPYLGSKIDTLYNEIVGEQLDGRRLNLFQKIIKEIYPYIYCCFSLIQIFCKFRYLYLPDSSNQNYYHLLYKLEKVHLERAQGQQEDHRYPILELLKKPALLIVLIGHKVLNWYFSQKKEKLAINKLKSEAISAPLQAQSVSDNGRCSICTKKLKNATLVRQTGYVYCWECICGYVKRENRCPLGGIQVNPESLQILYG